MALVGLRVSIVLRTLSKRRRTSRERRNSGNISLSPCSLYLYSCKLLFIAYILLAFLLLLSCHIVYSPSCIFRQLTFPVEPKFVKKVIKIASRLLTPPLVDIPILSARDLLQARELTWTCTQQQITFLPTSIEGLSIPPALLFTKDQRNR